MDNEIKLPVIAARHPYAVEVEAGKTYSWCSCGLTATEPFCDGAHKAHKNPDGTSKMKSVKYTATETKIVYFCGCKHSKNGAICDQTHCTLDA